MTEAPYPRWKASKALPPLPDKMVAQDGTVFNPNAPAAPRFKETPDLRPQAPGGLWEQAERDLKERPWAAGQTHDTLTTDEINEGAMQIQILSEKVRRGESLNYAEEQLLHALQQKEEKHDALTVQVDSFDARDELRPPPGEIAALDASTRTHEEDDPQCEHRQTVERHPSGGKINVRCYLDKAHSGLHHAWTPSQREITW